MTHPDTPEVGGSNDEPIVAAQPTLEDRFAAVSGEEKKPEEEEGEAPAQEAGAEPELTPEDVADEDEAELPLIAPPVSWKDDEKEEFKQLPRALQETLARREAEREQFVQSKAQEAKQTRAQVEQEAIGILQQTHTAHTQALQALTVPVPEKPSYSLQNEDPFAFAEQMDAHERAAAHNQWIEQRVAQSLQQAQHLEQTVKAHAQQAMTQRLAQDFPEFLDPTTGPKLQQELTSIALELGYTHEQMPHADADDILAMKKASEWRADALKYRTLMAKKMERVREAKNLPKVTKPGAAQPRGLAENQRYAADRQAMRGGDTDAAARVYGRFLNT